MILPQRNEVDLDELPEDVRKEMDFILVERIDQVLETALRAEAESAAERIPANGREQKAEEELQR